MKFSSEHQPSQENRVRGRNKRTLFIEALKKEGKDEEGFYRLCIEVAMGRHESCDGKPDNQMLKEVLSRLAPMDKQTLPIYDFEFPADGTKLEKAEAIVDAVGSGDLPVDAAKLMMDLLESAASIEEKEELAERVQKLEELLDASSNA